MESYDLLSFKSPRCSVPQGTGVEDAIETDASFTIRHWIGPYDTLHACTQEYVLFLGLKFEGNLVFHNR